MFKSYDTGFHITFRNGFTVSVQWGNGKNGSPNNYAHTRDTVGLTAEVAIWDQDGAWYRFYPQTGTLNRLISSDVMGWQAPADVAAILAAVASF